MEQQLPASHGRGPGRLWYDMTGLTAHRGGITGIQRVQLGIAERLLRDERWRDVGFCFFEKQIGFRVLRRPAVVDILATIGTHPRSWFEDGRSSISLARKIRRFFLRRFSAKGPFARGDVLLNLGFSTYYGRYRDVAENIIAPLGVRYVGMLYDVLSLKHPEWWNPEQVEGHRPWFAFTCRMSHPILCCSAATQRDVEWFLEKEGIAARPVRTVRLADELLPPAIAPARAASPAPTRPYVLYVSQIDVRKNHRLLLEVWRKLVATHGAERVPDLLCVGRLGFRGEELVRELRSGVDGRIRIQHDIGDAELGRLYDGCLFTVYPSLAEGWGLPIGESLGHGKYCIASSSSSLPEVGGDLIDYHDPADAAHAAELIARAAFDADFRAAREAQIRRRYRIRTWCDALDEIALAVGDSIAPD
jgi:glycosyltransferase involved in cell wall biosynthesis